MAGSRNGSGEASGKGGLAVPLGDADEVERVFRHFDANGDGKISASELAEVVRALSGSEGTASEEEVRRMMEELDSNRDGYVDLAEFVAFHRGGGGGGGGAAGDAERELKEAFRMYDLNGDGVISARELHQVMKRLGDKCSVRDCSRMIRSVDADGDGTVNFHEFKKMMSISGNGNGNGGGKKQQHNRLPK
uniref:Putative calcium-binding protein CML18 n=1 Tax=Anthurium amnicola TaxID=1678845 RepID=A0A1D1Z038_9ARAE